jgi:predicted DNA-binding transcriptional regulator AlpA
MRKTRRNKKQEAQAVPLGEILTDEQCAALLGIKPRTLRLWRRVRGLPFCKITSREIRYRLTDINQWLEQRRCAMTA